MAQPTEVAMQAQMLEPETVTSTQDPLAAAHARFEARASIPAALDQPAKIVLTPKSKQAWAEFPQRKSLRFDLSSVVRCKDISESGGAKAEINKDDELNMVRSVSLRLPPGLGVEVDNDEQLPLGRSKSLPVAGLRLPDGLPSRGSALHDIGGCQPCAWFWKSGGCKNDRECSRCHACPEGEVKVRRRAKKTMLRLGHVTPVAPSTNIHETAVSNFIPEPLKAAPVMTEDESTSCSGSALESASPDSCGEADVAGSSAPFTPQRVSEWPGASLGLCGLAAAPVSESGTLSTGVDADHEEDEELYMMQSSSFHAPPGLELPKAGDASNGAMLHEMGACQPCAWFWKPSGCQNGKDSMRCHLCPEGEVKARKKVKLTMMRLGLVTPKAKASGAFELPIA